MSEHFLFEGTQNYIAAGNLKSAVNIAIALERPLLVNGYCQS